MQTEWGAWPRCGLARPAGVLSGEDLAAQPEPASGRRLPSHPELGGDGGGRHQVLEWGRCVL
jgi:hypothetical protein